MRAQWKTGRQYSEHGQRIIAEEVTPGTSIVFRDLDRGIDGVFGPAVIGKFKAGNELALQLFVMNNYDEGNYTEVTDNAALVHIKTLAWETDHVDECERRGKMIVDLLGLKPLRGYEDPRYDTSGGTKTVLGLYNTVKRIIEKGE
jgi:hypothetical protein